ncbi:MAG TPA: type VI secretion system protein TssA [Planctomycetaceae bacterium]|nr:type VI secretion system protein TssA [Planctomycetaceae bacterium]|tara:strand:+ start:23097 stop:24257 length:1161 start_codon:yes stop_codon:yes gene_type:complete
MATPVVLDFEAILAPVSDEQPAGVALKEDREASVDYYRIKDARDASRNIERKTLQAAWTGDDLAAAEPTQWRDVLEISTTVLAETSKDLWIAAWLIEAAAREHGFAGLREGFSLIQQLCEQYWDEIYPRPDEDGIATTLAQLTGLNGVDADGALIPAIAAIPLTDSTTHGRLSSADYLDAVDLEQSADAERREQRIQEGAVSMEMFEQAVNETSPEFFQELSEDLQGAMEAYQRMGEVLEEKCSLDSDGYSQAPPASNIKNALQACQDRLSSIAGHLLAEPTVETEAEDPNTIGSPANSETASVTSARQVGGIETREQAFELVTEIAKFFRRKEPHSPVPYALDQAIRWGRMSLPELLQELAEDDSIRRAMFQQNGSAGDDAQSED